METKWKIINCLDTENNMALCRLNKTIFALCIILLVVAIQSNELGVNERCPPCSRLEGPCLKKMNYSSILNARRKDDDILLMLNLPYKVSREGIEDMTGDSRNGGGHYASAAFVAMEDINRYVSVLKHYFMWK